MDIKAALMQMDAFDDNQWTADGAPKLDALSELVGEKVKRQDVMDVAPEFSKDNMVVPSDEDKEKSSEDEEDKEKSSDEGNDEDKEKSSDDEDKEKSSDDDDDDEDGVDLSGVKEYLKGEPLPEAQFIPFLMSLPTEALETLQSVLIMQLEEIEKTISKATDLKSRLKLSKAYTTNRIKAEVPDISNQEAIQHFIKTQTAARGAKVAATRALLKGIDLKSLDPRAAIDRAMARKNSRGNTRPKRNLMGR